MGIDRGAKGGQGWGQGGQGWGQGGQEGPGGPSSNAGGPWPLAPPLATGLLNPASLLMPFLSITEHSTGVGELCGNVTRSARSNCTGEYRLSALELLVKNPVCGRMSYIDNIKDNRS